MEVFKFAINFVHVMSKSIAEKLLNEFTNFQSETEIERLTDIIEKELNNGILTNLGIEEKLLKIKRMLELDTEDANVVLAQVIEALDDYYPYEGESA